MEPTDEDFAEATAPARWLLRAGEAGIPLTQTHALARAVVEEAALRWPDWWSVAHGPPRREADVAPLQALHGGLRRRGLVRRRGRVLRTTARGSILADDPEALLRTLAADIGSDDPFTEAVAAAVMQALEGGEPRGHDAIARAVMTRVRRQGWQGPDGSPPGDDVVRWSVAAVLIRAEGYGVVERHPDPALGGLPLASALTAAGRAVLGPQPAASGHALVFRAELVDVRGVSARVAVLADQHLTALHDAIREAFGWADDHLYAFWLDNRFWGGAEGELTSPVVPGTGARTADLPIAELDLRIGAKLAYIFDFGDEWRVRLTLEGGTPADAGAYPRVIARRGEAPSQYPDGET